LGEKEKRDTEEGLDSLIHIIQTLRGENGCPWDRKQTPETMWKCLAEEVYELLEAIEDGDVNDVCDETGDVLFQLVFIAELYREQGNFDLSDCIARSAKKMIRRHPHVYGDLALKSEEELFQRWESIKREEKLEAGKGRAKSVLDSVPKGMTALLRSYKISERAVRSGFDWDDMSGVLEKVEEEWQEFTEALAKGDKDEIALEFGDILFTLANVARFAGIHPETALARSTDKFEKRFRHMEALLAERNEGLKDLSRTEKDSLWEEAKKAYDCDC